LFEGRWNLAKINRISGTLERVHYPVNPVNPVKKAFDSRTLEFRQDKRILGIQERVHYPVNPVNPLPAAA
jgi:hypothetical protein